MFPIDINYCAILYFICAILGGSKSLIITYGNYRRGYDITIGYLFIESLVVFLPIVNFFTAAYVLLEIPYSKIFTAKFWDIPVIKGKKR